MAQEPNRNRTGTVGTVFPGTERGTGTAATVLQEPKPEPEPSSLLHCPETHKNPLLRGTAGTENRNRSNRSIPKPCLNRTGATLRLFFYVFQAMFRICLNIFRGQFRPEGSAKVSPETGLGPWMALPSRRKLSAVQAKPESLYVLLSTLFLHSVNRELKIWP